MNENTYTATGWEEKIVGGGEGGPRVAHARATMAYTGVLEGTSVCEFLLYYAGAGYDGAGQKAPGYERFEGAVHGRKGTFVARHDTAYDGHGIRDHWTVVAGSATGELTGLSGTGTATAVMGADSVSYTFDYSW
jgi:hypothetical protein